MKRIIAVALTMAFTFTLCAGFASAANADVKFLPIDISGSGKDSINILMASDFGETTLTLNVNTLNYATLATGTIYNLYSTEYYLNGTSIYDIMVSGSGEYVPIFLQKPGALVKALALYAENDTVAELDILSGSEVSITKGGTAVSLSGRISGNRLTLKGGELAVITGFAGNNCVLNGSAITVSELGTFRALSGPGSGSSSGGSSELDIASLKLALDSAKEFESRENDYTSESWMRFEAAYSFAKTVYANASATEQEVSAAANNLFAALDGLEQNYKAPSGRAPLKVTDKAEFTLNMTKDVTVQGETLVIEIKAADAAYISTAVINFSCNGTLQFEYAGGQNSYTALAVNYTSGNGSVTLINNNFANAQANSFAATDADTVIARLRFRAISTGSATVELSSAQVAAVDGSDEGTDVDTALVNARVNFTVIAGSAAPDLPLDFNGDFNVTLADIATVQAWYRVSAATNAELWNSRAKYADYDHDGIITVADYLLILAAYNQWLKNA